MNGSFKYVGLINGKIKRLKSGEIKIYEFTGLKPDVTREDVLDFIDKINDSGVLRPELKIQLWEKEEDLNEIHIQRKRHGQAR